MPNIKFIASDSYIVISDSVLIDNCELIRTLVADNKDADEIELVVQYMKAADLLAAIACCADPEANHIVKNSLDVTLKFFNQVMFNIKFCSVLITMYATKFKDCIECCRDAIQASLNCAHLIGDQLNKMFIAYMIAILNKFAPGFEHNVKMPIIENQLATFEFIEKYQALIEHKQPNNDTEPKQPTNTDHKQPNNDHTNFTEFITANGVLIAPSRLVPFKCGTTENIQYLKLNTLLTLLNNTNYNSMTIKDGVCINVLKFFKQMDMDADEFIDAVKVYLTKYEIDYKELAVYFPKLAEVEQKAMQFAVKLRDKLISMDILCWTEYAYKFHDKYTNEFPRHLDKLKYFKLSDLTPCEDPYEYLECKAAIEKLCENKYFAKCIANIPSYERRFAMIYREDKRINVQHLKRLIKDSDVFKNSVGIEIIIQFNHMRENSLIIPNTYDILKKLYGPA